MFIVMFGPPGSGKGTQSEKIIAELGIPHFSTGAALREAKKSGTPVGRQVAEFIDRGQLVGDDLIMKVVEERLQKSDCHTGCLFDGIPRTLNQARQLDELLHRRDVALSHVIALDVPREELEQRLLKRARVEGRADDTPETINKRMEVYERQTAPLLDFYRSQGLLRCINAVGTPEGVFRKIQPFLES